MNASSPPSIGLSILHDTGDVSIETLRRIGKVLSKDELDRLECFRDPARQRQFLLTHLAAREVIAARLGCLASAVHLESDPTGRPRALDCDRRELVSLSLSHSGEFIAIATAPAGCSIGVDVEGEIAPGSMPPVRKVLLAETERLWLDQLPEENRPPALTRLWTAKEAALKSHGAGLGVPLTSLQVDFRSATVTAHSSELSGCQWAIECFSCISSRDRRKFFGTMAVLQSAASPGHPLHKLTRIHQPRLTEALKILGASEMDFSERDPDSVLGQTD
jgi:phosphopantetheinyl transferase